MALKFMSNSMPIKALHVREKKLGGDFFQFPSEARWFVSLPLKYLKNHKSYKKNFHTLPLGNVPRILHTKSEMSTPNSSQDMLKSVIFTYWPTEIPEMAG